MLTVIRELAEEAEERAAAQPSVPDLLLDVVKRGEDAVRRTPEQLAVLREAGVVDAGGAGLVEILRGIAAGVAGEPLPEAQPAEGIGFDAIHQELSRYRYCTTFVLEGDGLDREAIEEQVGRFGDSLLVVGDSALLKVHVHTDDPGAVLTLGTGLGAIDSKTGQGTSVRLYLPRHHGNIAALRGSAAKLPNYAGSGETVHGSRGAVWKRPLSPHCGHPPGASAVGMIFAPSPRRGRSCFRTTRT